MPHRSSQILIVMISLLYYSIPSNGMIFSRFPGKSNLVSKTVDSSSLVLGPVIGDGAFGIVHWGRLKKQSLSNMDLDQEDSSLLVVAKEAKKNVKNAVTYLDTEAYLNGRLRDGSSMGDHNDQYHNHPNIAPYIGECYKDSKRYLIWQASGNSTLEDFLNNRLDDDRKEPYNDIYNALGNDLDVPSVQTSQNMHILARKVLHQLLTGLAYCHSKGIVHRDIKPANILVDKNTNSLRFIDFGSAADMASFTDRRGYRGENKGVRNLLYCAPEEFVDQDYPYAFDVYSVAVCWVRIMVSGLRISEDAFFDFRMEVRDCRHDLKAWRDACIANNDEAMNKENNEKQMSMPEGWQDLFHSGSEGQDAFNILNQMMQYEPEHRPSASELLLQPYLNPACSESKQPSPPARPWSLTSHFEKVLHEQSISNRDECEIPEWFLDEMIFGEEISKLNSLKKKTANR